MPSEKYPFFKFRYPDGTLDPRGRTYLPVRISNPKSGASLTAWGIVDAGADACLFPAGLAAALGHDLKARGVRSSVTIGIEQKPVPTYKHTFGVELLSADLQNVVWSSLNMEVDCVEPDPPVLLGVEGFLDQFRLTIDYRHEELPLNW